MPTDSTIQIVKSTVPVLASHGLSIVARFYERIFAAHPALKNVFNMRHQQTGEQHRALAHAVHAYAANIDNLDALQAAVARIVHKHCSLNVAPEHYPIVGEHLLGAMQDVLGDAATPAIIGAWGEAYGALAKILIDAEAKEYSEVAARPGGWRGWRDFVVVHKRKESDTITTFYLAAKDGGPVGDFKPGQYISINVDVPRLGLQQARQYSLSDAPNSRTYRITVKRETGSAGDGPDGAGYVSNLLHDHVAKGHTVQATPPFGHFHVDMAATTPVVLISGGVGLTALVSMLKAVLRNTARELVFVHGTENSAVHAMRQRLSAVAETNSRLTSIVFYEKPLPEDDQDYDFHFTGRVDLQKISSQAIRPDADYYICGPVPFIQAQVKCLKALGIAAERIHYEVFGVDGGEV